MTGEAAAAAACTVVAAAAAVAMVAGLIRDLPHLGQGFAVAGIAVVVMAAGAIAVSVTAGRTTARARSRTVTFRSEPGGPLWATRLHEAGHVVMTRRLGGHVTRVTVNPDGSGLTEAVFPPWVDLGPVDELAMDHAGAAAEGISFDSAPCSGDRASARETLRQVPWSGRSWVSRKGKSIAHTTVAPGLLGPRSEVARVARQLPSPGTRRFRR